MINSVSNTTPTHQWQLQQHQQTVAANKAKSPEPKDSVVLSKVAAGQVDADHDGDSH
jgi:hypothetical protein